MLDDAELFLATVGDVLGDVGFQLPTPQASDALEEASSLLDWCAHDANEVAC